MTPLAARRVPQPRAEWARAAEELVRGRERSRREPIVAVFRLAEAVQLRDRFGRAGLERVVCEAAALIGDLLAGHELVGTDGDGGILVLLRGTTGARARKRLVEMIQRVNRADFPFAGDHLHVTPICGWASAGHPFAALELADRATVACEIARGHLDLLPRRWQQSDGEPPPRRLSRGARTWLQALSTVALGVVLPFLLLVALYSAGFDIGAPVYLTVLVALLITSAFIWAEGLRALSPPPLPEDPGGPHPPASAVIAAYLPNEAATIADTLRSFLRQDYPGPLQIVLAYNTPGPLPVERELAAMAAADPRLVLLKVDNSTSKAQNVNAALQVVTGEFTAIFDADHHPAPDAFRRAWRWLADGADVVQGHCVIRNGGTGAVARMVAVEFESIYAVSHTGRAALHHFGLFGGSNGFWRTRVLRETRMQGHMLTEDIDSTFRTLLSGRELVYDPGLLSRELAPTTLKALWHQRMRWAQGWFQVSRRHLGSALRSPGLSHRQKLGAAFLLGWREVYPWLSLLIFPVMAFLIWRAGGIGELDWTIPTFLLTSLYTISAGPATVLFTWRLAAPEIRRNRVWFLAYLFFSILFYTEMKNLISRTAQLKELSGERQWVVTPRAAPAAEVRLETG
ncbi:glycosyltransferase [Amycolatopsis sp. CA-230715]|uniref:glycosyltransferase n=1 Tax=Amycolatopsis sp. CA-230715 TaxID=2745196 RepID=UPI001C0123C5|nr:glycosyltransferase family 2 protein [Amycolatopsis sp. CA-230715]